MQTEKALKTQRKVNMFSHQVLTTSLSCLLYLSSQSQHSGSLFAGIVGRISPPTWTAMETFLASVGNGQYTAMATALVQMGATDSAVDITSFSRDLEKIFSAVQVTLLKRSSALCRIKHVDSICSGLDTSVFDCAQSCCSHMNEKLCRHTGVRVKVNFQSLKV